MADLATTALKGRHFLRVADWKPDELTVTLEVPRVELKERSKAILDRLPVVDFNIEDIPVEEGIALLFQKQGAPDAVA